MWFEKLDEENAFMRFAVNFGLFNYFSDCK